MMTDIFKYGLLAVVPVCLAVFMWQHSLQAETVLSSVMFFWGSFCFWVVSFCLLLDLGDAITAWARTIAEKKADK